MPSAPLGWGCPLLAPHPCMGRGGVCPPESPHTKADPQSIPHIHHYQRCRQSGEKIKQHKIYNKIPIHKKFTTKYTTNRKKKNPKLVKIISCPDKPMGAWPQMTLAPFANP